MKCGMAALLPDRSAGSWCALCSLWLSTGEGSGNGGERGRDGKKRVFVLARVERK